MANNLVRIRAVLDDKVSSGLDKISDRFKTLGTTKGFQSLVTGVGLGVGAAAFNLLGQAASKAADFIGDSVTAALEDEASQQKLRSSLTANIKAWDGNTASIEKTLKARMALGFSDDEQRTSLATLVAATGDVTKALDIQRTAMDLARLKGISLADASDALTKVEAGSYRILKSLGIVLKDGATQQDALNAVQKIATGQAADYAKTVGGKLLVEQVKMQEAMEAFGYKIMPIVSKAVDVATVAVDALSFAMGDLGTATSEKAAPSMIDFLPVIGQVKQVISDTPKVIGDASDAWGEFSGATKAAGDDLRETNTILGTTKHAITLTQDEIDALARKSRDTSRIVKNAFADINKSLADDAQSMIDDYFDPIENREDVLAARTKLHEAEKVLAKKHTATEARAASQDIQGALRDEGEALDKLGAKGKLSAKAVDNYETDVTAAYKSLGKKVPPEIQKIIDKLHTLASIRGTNISVRVVGGNVQDFSSLSGGARASGGPVDPWTAYTVGERGPETLVMGSQGGTIIPNGGGGGMTLVVNTVWPPTPAQLRQMASALNEHNGYGFDQAPPTRSG